MKHRLCRFTGELRLPDFFCHQERSDHFAKRNGCAVEGPRAPVQRNSPSPGVFSKHSHAGCPTSRVFCEKACPSEAEGWGFLTWFNPCAAKFAAELRLPTFANNATISGRITRARSPKPEARSPKPEARSRPTPPSSVSSPAISSARGFPYPRASPPTETGAESEPPYPACC